MKIDKVSAFFVGAEINGKRYIEELTGLEVALITFAKIFAVPVLATLIVIKHLIGAPFLPFVWYYRKTRAVYNRPLNEKLLDFDPTTGEYKEGK